MRTLKERGTWRLGHRRKTAQAAHWRSIRARAAERARGNATTVRVRPRRMPVVELIFVFALLMLVATVLLLGLAFQRLMGWSTHTPPTRPAPPQISQEVNPVSTPHRVEVVLRLRDLVAGMVFVSNRQPELALRPDQRKQLADLLPVMRKNIEGPPEAVDVALEKRVGALLDAAQTKALMEWVREQKGPPDYMSTLKQLEQMCGVAGSSGPAGAASTPAGTPAVPAPTGTPGAAGNPDAPVNGPAGASRSGP